LCRNQTPSLTTPNELGQIKEKKKENSTTESSIPILRKAGEEGEEEIKEIE